MLEVASTPPIGLDFHRVTALQESKVDENLWHIARVPYNSSNAYWAVHVATKKKCTAKIVTNVKNIPALTYLGVWNYYKFITPKVEKIFFSRTTLSIVSRAYIASGLTNSLLTKIDLKSCSCGLSSFVLTSLVWRS